MPRKARIDAPGALHHFIVRRIERRKVFKSKHDRKNFLQRLSGLIPETRTDCFAWILIPNHVFVTKNWFCSDFGIDEQAAYRICRVVQ